MHGYKQVSETLEVPREAGVEGFVASIRNLLKLPRLQGLSVDNRGKVQYTYFTKEGEENEPFRMAFDDLMPYAIIRNSDVRELFPIHENTAIAAGQMFRAAALDQLYPIAFAVGSNTLLWSWLRKSTGLEEMGGTFFGLPVVSDREIEDSTVVLCASYGPGAEMIATVRSYRVVIPEKTT